jgi:hypothetical protein
MKNNRLVILKGEGVNQHVLVGNFEADVNTATKTFTPISIKSDCLLKHEKPNGNWSNEHNTLKVEKGSYRMGRQVEYNPFKQSISTIWD